MAQDIKQLAKEFFELTMEVLERQSTALPCIFYHEGLFDYSRGDQLGGMHELVYNDIAEIVVDTEKLKELVRDRLFDEFSDEQCAEIISEYMYDFFESKLEEEGA